MDVPFLPTADAADAEASRLTLHGISLLEQGGEKALRRAVAFFQQAILLREELPLDQNPAWRWGLSAGWLNLADALLRLHGAEGREDAVTCCGVALNQLKHLLPEANPLYRWRHAVAWVNLGQAEELGGEEENLRRAMAYYKNALRLMEGHESSERADFQQVQAAIWLNLANGCLSEAHPKVDLALDCTRQSLTHSRLLEAEHGTICESGLKARHLLCRSLAVKLESPGMDASVAEGWIHEATDAVEEVIAATGNGGTWDPLREEMFHFGCRIYRAFQPHFLASFLQDGLNQPAPSEAVRSAAREALAQAVLQYRHQPLAGLSAEKMEKLLQTLQNLAEMASAHAGILQADDKKA